jgi:two-component system cell cycle sensor histidine kinase/response regulator CckA
MVGLNLQIPALTLLLLFAAASSAAMSFFVLRNTFLARAKYFIAALFISCALWLIGAALQPTSVTVSTKLFWENIRMIGCIALPTAYFLVIVNYSNNDRWLSRKLLMALAVPPAFFLLLLLTNPAFHFFWSKVAIDESAATPVLAMTGGWGYWAHIVYSFVLLLTSMILLVRMLPLAEYSQRGQIFLLLLAMLAVGGAIILKLMGVLQLPDYDPTAFVISVMLPTAAFALRYLHSSSILPMAQDAIIEVLPEGIIVFDCQGNIVYSNEASKRLLDHDPKTKIDVSLDRLWPGLRETLVSLPLKAEINNEVILFHGNDERTYDVRISALTNNTDQIEGRLMTIRDISERKLAEAKLIESEERYRLLAKNSTDVITRHDPHGIFLYVSPASFATLGYEPDELLHQSIFDYIHPDDREVVLRAHVRILCEPRTHTTTYRLRRKDGDYVWVETSSRTIYAAGRDGGGPNEIVSVSRDITERKTAEDALLSERERLLVTLQSIGDGVLALNAQGRVVLANAKAEEHLAALSGVGVGDELTLLGNRSLESFLLPPPRGKACHEIKLTEPAPRFFEVVAQPMGGETKSSGWVLVTRDITDERETQRRVQLQERLAAVGQLAAGIAHDFNNIIGAIILYSEMVLQTPDLEEKNRERMTTIFQQAGRAATLTRQILDFSRRTVMDQAPMDLISFLKETEKLLSRTLRENIQLRLDCQDNNCVINADPTRIQQIIMNLAFNAQDAMPHGGELCFELSHIRVEDGKSGPYRDMAPGIWIQLKVADSGVGMPPEITQHIFEPFFTTKEPGAGSGLGLAQVYGIVKQHGGYIDVESRVGLGTTFVIYFPALEVPVEETATMPGTFSASGDQEQILVVEDDEATLNAVFEILETLNYRVYTARDGRQALEIIERENGNIDLILSDLVLPEMGGVALYRELENRSIDTKIIFMTGYPLGTGTKELLDYNKVTWMQKPVRSETLANVIYDAINNGKK